MKIVHLKPLSSFRTELHSDTLWGLLMIAIKNVYSEAYLEEILEQFKSEKPPFKVSSAFYYYQKDETLDSKRIYYLPKPIFKSNIEIEEPDLNDEKNKQENLKRYRNEREKLKSYRKLSLVDLDTFEKIINGEISDKELFKNFNPEEDSKSEKILKKEVVAKKASLDRLTNTTREENGKGQLFSMNEIYLESGGLYFLVEGDTSIIEPALRYLHHFGFGADSSNGKGHFALTDDIFEDFSIRQPETSSLFVNLSIYSPTQEELTEYKKIKDKLYYNLEKRAGKIGVTFFETGDIYKDSVLCFGEGSVFPNIPSINPVGKISTVKEFGEKNIYHSGLAFTIKANLRET